MKAIVVSEKGGPEVLTVSDIPEPHAGAREVVVEVAAVGVNYIDTYQRRGVYDIALPFVPGLEGAGVVVEVGSGVTEFALGDQVAWSGAQGSYAEKVAVNVDKAMVVPQDMDLKDAAQALLQGVTAQYLVASVFPVGPGHTALVHAAAGGVGLLLTQMIKARGGTVIATVSTEEKAKLVSSVGADHVIRYDQEDFLPRVTEITVGVGVDVVFDGVGKTTFDQSLRSLKTRGMMVLFGQASGPVPPVDSQLLNSLGSLLLTRPTLGDFTQTPEEFRWRASEVLNAIVSGDVTLTLGAHYPLTDAQQAHIDLESRKTSGKLLLIP